MWLLRLRAQIYWHTADLINVQVAKQRQYQCFGGLTSEKSLSQCRISGTNFRIITEVICMYDITYQHHEPIDKFYWMHVSDFGGDLAIIRQEKRSRWEYSTLRCKQHLELSAIQAWECWLLLRYHWHRDHPEGTFFLRRSHAGIIRWYHTSC